MAQEIRAATVPVIDDLEAMALPPDVIHGQHHLETMTALLRFPGVPAIYFCHGWIPWEELPPRFPRILRYVAVDNVCRDRMVLERAIPEDRTRVLLNFVDLERFKSRGPLPLRPRRAVVLSNYATEQNSLAAIREACARKGIALDVFGIGSGNTCAAPEAVLGNYDIAFAKGRSALEALAAGAAVILCDPRGAGPMVTTGNLDRLRPLNFGIRTLHEPVDIEILSREIASYDPVDAAAVSRCIRTTAGREAVVDELLSIYQEVIEEHNRTAGANIIAEQRAAASYLREISAGLAARELALAQIFDSRGARLLSRYGALKQKILLPVYNHLGGLLRLRLQGRKT